MGTGRAFHKAVPEIEKAFYPVLICVGGTINLFQDRRFFRISAEQVIQPDMQTGCFSE